MKDDDVVESDVKPSRALRDTEIAQPISHSSHAWDLSDRMPAVDEAAMYRISATFQIANTTTAEESWYRLLTNSLWWRSFWRDMYWAINDRYHSYFWRHLAVWVLLALLLSGPMYATGLSKDMPYIDALFYVTSAVTATGLETRDLSLESTATPILLWFCMLFGGAVFDSTLPLFVRLWNIRKELRNNNIDESQHALLQKEQSITIILLVIITSYWFLTQLVTFLAVGFYFQYSEAGHATIVEQGTNSWWTALFGTVSAFNNCGFFLFGTSLIPLSSQILPLIFFAAMILLGNTIYPVFLRMLVRITAIALSRRPAWQRQAENVQLLLDEPRSFLTHMFSSNHTWRLLALQIGLITLQTILLVALPQDSAFEGLTPGYQFANALFQSISVRTCGLTSIPIANLSDEALIVMIAMMYLASYPITASLRSSNVLQREPKQSLQYQLRRLLLQDLMWVIFPWFLITACEGYTEFKPAFSTLFEVVSAYGPVGLSVGVAHHNWSFSGSYGVASKLIIILVMLLGRHRDMPDTFDSVFIPSSRVPEIKTRVTSRESYRSNTFEQSRPSTLQAQRN